MLAVIAVTVVFALPQAWAAAPPDNPLLVVHLDANGSLVVSLRDRAADAAITLPSVQALPAEIDALVPRRGERKRIAVTVDSAVSWRNLLNFMYKAGETGFGNLDILGSGIEPQGAPFEVVIPGGPNDPRVPLSKDALNHLLFVSLRDGIVDLQLGLGDGATVMHVNRADALEAAVGLVPKERARNAYFRADS